MDNEDYVERLTRETLTPQGKPLTGRAGRQHNRARDIQPYVHVVRAYGSSKSSEQRSPQA